MEERGRRLADTFISAIELRKHLRKIESTVLHFIGTVGDPHDISKTNYFLYSRKPLFQPFILL